MRIAFHATFAFVILFVLAMIPATAQEGPDEDEPNDTMRHATEIDGLTIEGEVGGRGDTDDWFVLEGQEGTNPTIYLEYDEDDCDIDLEVYSDDELVGSLTSTDSPDSDDFYVPGECYIHVYAYEGRGEYSIEIEPGEGGGDEECQGPDEVESNDTPDLADYIEDLEFEGYACEGEDDWFVLGGQEGTRPEITLRYDEDECDIDLEVYTMDEDDFEDQDWDEMELVGSLTSTDSPDRDEFRVPDVCLIHVYSYDGEGEYTIEIEP